MQLLVVEDNRDVAENLKFGLEAFGYGVQVAYDGIDGEAEACAGEFDAIVVDWMMPGQDGPQMIERLREKGIETPILMLTARAENRDQVEALDVGADDYLAKPFSFEVLGARVRALLRRSTQTEQQAADAMTLEAGPLRLNVRERTASAANEVLPLREKEFRLLALFVENANRVLTRTVIAERVWDDTFATDDVLNTTVSSLRRVLKQSLGADSGVQIETLRGVGYRFAVAEAAEAVEA